MIDWTRRNFVFGIPATIFAFASMAKGDETPEKHIDFVDFDVIDVETLKKICENPAYPETVHMRFEIPPNDEALWGFLDIQFTPSYQTATIDLRNPYDPENKEDLAKPVIDFEEHKKFYFMQTNTESSIITLEQHIDKGVQRYKLHNEYHPDQARPQTFIDVIGQTLYGKKDDLFFRFANRDIYIPIDQEDARTMDNKKLKQRKELTGIVDDEFTCWDNDLDPKCKEIRVRCVDHKGKKVPYQIEFVYEINKSILGWNPDVTMKARLTAIDV